MFLRFPESITMLFYTRFGFSLLLFALQSKINMRKWSTPVVANLAKVAAMVTQGIWIGLGEVYGSMGKGIPKLSRIASQEMLESGP